MIWDEHSLETVRFYLGLGLLLYSFKSNQSTTGNPQRRSGVGDGLQALRSRFDSYSRSSEFFFLKNWRDLHSRTFFEKKLYCIEHQHGRLITWLQTKNNKFCRTPKRKQDRYSWLKAGLKQASKHSRYLSLNVLEILFASFAPFDVCSVLGNHGSTSQMHWSLQRHIFGSPTGRRNAGSCTRSEVRTYRQTVIKIMLSSNSKSFYTFYLIFCSHIDWSTVFMN